MNWTDANIAALCEAWAANRTMDMIAVQLGTTRNGISGKINRLRTEGYPAMIQADAKRGPRLSRMDQAAEWMADHDGRMCDLARFLGIAPDQARKAWLRVVDAMGVQAV